MVDAHTWWRMGDQSYTPETVEQLAEAARRVRGRMAGGTAAAGRHEAYRRLKEADLVPLASGEHEPNELRYLDLILDQQSSITCRWTSSTRAAIPAPAASCPISPTRSCVSPSTAGVRPGSCRRRAAWRLLAGDVVEWLEYPVYSSPQLQANVSVPLAAEILKEPLQIEQGTCSFTRAGIGSGDRRNRHQTGIPESRALVHLYAAFATQDVRGNRRPHGTVCGALNMWVAAGGSLACTTAAVLAHGVREANRRLYLRRRCGGVRRKPATLALTSNDGPSPGPRVLLDVLERIWG